MNLTNEQLQVGLTGIFGDGHLTVPAYTNSNSYYATSCKFKEYMDFKKELLGDLYSSELLVEKNGYSQTPINILRSKVSPDFNILRTDSTENNLMRLDELGIAMWVYDDGSLHQKKMFYNLNTQAFPKEVQEELFIPFFNSYNIFPKVTIERKKDGRVFHYLSISRYEGAYEINKLLQKFPVSCYSYKMWDIKELEKWDKFKEDNITGKDLRFALRSEALKGKVGRRPYKVVLN